VFAVWTSNDGYGLIKKFRRTVKASITEGKRPVCVVGKAKLKVDRNKYFQKNPRGLCGRHWFS
jgi:hypothetical protein